MKDARTSVHKYLLVIIMWMIPVVLILTAIVYPMEQYLRDMLVLPVIVVLLYVAFLLAPMFTPIKNVNYFDEVPSTIERFVLGQRAREDARELLKLWHDGSLPNVYELTALTKFQKDVLRIVTDLRADTEWHNSSLQLSEALLERMDTLMGLHDEEVDESMTTPVRKPRHKAHRS
ncbi:MAG: hypothetical protein JW846_02330 [Dehalococcoidia bacterium]|nr:hypothetical protein [Dehalococcoidia bacterium]